VPLQATSIYEPVQAGLERVEQNLLDVANLRFPFLAQVLGHVFESKGKRIRPAIALLASKFSDHDPKITEVMASSVELLHVASLIHDDTVDESDIRRGRATLSSLWGRSVAVQAGDYVFASAAAFMCDTGDIQVIRRFSQTIMELASGQLQEAADAHVPDQTRDDYLGRIYNKTASLFETASESGAILSGAPEETVDAMRIYGHSLGLGFQIVDDILDFEGAEEVVGKPVGSDLANGVLTLPAIIAMERSPSDNPVRALFREPGDERRLAEAVAMVQEPAIIEESYEFARSLCHRSLECLTNLPRIPARDSLEEIVEYVLTRRK